jgi:hypothetical protein
MLCHVYIIVWLCFCYFVYAYIQTKIHVDSWKQEKFIVLILD